MIVERGNRTLHHRGGTWTLPHLSLLPLGMVAVMCKGGKDTVGGWMGTRRWDGRSRRIGCRPRRGMEGIYAHLDAHLNARPACRRAMPAMKGRRGRCSDVHAGARGGRVPDEPLRQVPRVSSWREPIHGFHSFAVRRSDDGTNTHTNTHTHTHTNIFFMPMAFKTVDEHNLGGSTTRQAPLWAEFPFIPRPVRPPRSGRTRTCHARAVMRIQPSVW